MKSWILTACAAALVLPCPAYADLTIQYKTDTRAGPGIPAAMADMVKQQVGASMSPESSIRIKGTRVYSNLGGLSSILDYATGQLTILHIATKKYAVLPASEYAAQIGAAMPEGARAMLQSATVEIKVDKTGRTAEVHGIPAEESVVVMSMVLPNPAGEPVEMRMEMHNWIATAAALTRFPELTQWDAKKWSAAGALDPARMVSSLFAQGPAGDKLRASLQEIHASSTGLTLKTDTRVFMSMIARMLAMQGVPSEGPLVNSIMEIQGFNSDTIPDAVFEVPPDYKAAPLAEILLEANPNKPRLPPQ